MDDVTMMDKNRTNTQVAEKKVTAEESNVSFEDLMARIRDIALGNRLRVGVIFFMHNIWQQNWPITKIQLFKSWWY